MGDDARNDSAEEGGQLALWGGLLVAPAAYFFQLAAAYGLVGVVCRSGRQMIFHLITLAALALCLFGAYLSWRSWDRVGREYPGEGGDRVTRTRFMAVGGLLLSALFIVGVLAQEIPTWVVGACVGR